MSLLQPSKTYKPFQYPWAVELAKKHEEIHWIEDEAELSEDVQDWKTKLSEDEKEFITQVLRLFTQSDVQVGENYHELLIPRFKNNEVRNMLSSFASREAVHQRAYALLNDTLGLPDEDYYKFLEYKEMADKIDFMKEGDCNSKSGLALALAQRLDLLLLLLELYGPLVWRGFVRAAAHTPRVRPGTEKEARAREPIVCIVTFKRLCVSIGQQAEI